MKIAKFRGTCVHGQFDYDVNFNKKLTFLTGDNGSGKTTVLNAIEALLMPRLDYLVLHEFESLELTFSTTKQKKVKLEARGDNEKVKITCSEFPKKEFVINRKIVTEFMLFELESKSSSEGIAKRLQRYVLDRMKDNTIYEYICSLPTPTYLGQERKKGFANQNLNSIELEESEIIFSKMLGFQLDDELTVAVNFAQSAISKCHLERNEFDRKRLKELMSFMLPPPKRERNISMKKIITIDNINSLYNKLLNLSKYVSYFVDKKRNTLRIFSDYVRDHLNSVKGIRDYANHNKKTCITYQENKDILIFDSYFVKNIDEIINISENYKNKIRNIYCYIYGFINTINDFFKNSNSKKILYYNEKGILQYKFSGNANKQFSLTAKTLSSGEKQLVVLFANLYFNPNGEKKNVLLIDEPETSFHVLWQELFVGAMLDASKRNQMIMATHSPIVIMHRVDRCESVIPEFHEKKNEKQ